MKEAINAERAGADLEGLEANPALEAVAGRQARRAARTRSLVGDPAEITEIGRSLRREGYRPFHWKQRLVLGVGDADRLLRDWRRGAPEDFRELILGDYEDLGIGEARTDRGLPVVSILVALPRSTVFYRKAAELDDLEAVRETIRAATNEHRAEAGRAPLDQSPLLDSSAQAYAERLRDEDHYGHVGPDGSQAGDRARAAGYHYRWMAENLAKGLFTPKEVVRRWSLSPDHRRNMLHPKPDEIGVGVAYGETGGELDVLWVVLLGRR